MTHKEENIVNISMMAAELLKDGRIERDDISGHAGLTETVISLAEQFEKEYAGVDWDVSNRDYWEEVDSFAKKELLERYGRDREALEHDNAAVGLRIKVIVSDGVVEGALKNADVPVSVEIVDVDEFYDDYEERKAYREELYKDRSLMPCDCAFAGLSDAVEELAVEIPENPVKVFAVSGSVKHEIFSGTFEECKVFCHEHRWSWLDENEFQWCLDMEDSREALLPDDYYDALRHYEGKVGRVLDGELTRVNAEKFVFCYHHELDINDFDFWVRYEELLGEEITFDEFHKVDAHFSKDPYDVDPTDMEAIDFLKGELWSARFQAEREAKLGSLDDASQNAEQPALSDQIQAAETQRDSLGRDDGVSVIEQER